MMRLVLHFDFLRWGLNIRSSHHTTVIDAEGVDIFIYIYICQMSAGSRREGCTTILISPVDGVDEECVLNGVSWPHSTSPSCSDATEPIRIPHKMFWISISKFSFFLFSFSIGSLFEKQTLFIHIFFTIIVWSRLNLGKYDLCIHNNGNNRMMVTGH